MIVGTLLGSTKLRLPVWFLAVYLIGEAKTGLSALALKRDLGGSYPTAWLIHHKLIQVSYLPPLASAGCVRSASSVLLKLLAN